MITSTRRCVSARAGPVVWSTPGAGARGSSVISPRYGAMSPPCPVAVPSRSILVPPDGHGASCARAGTNTFTRPGS